MFMYLQISAKMYYMLLLSGSVMTGVLYSSTYPPNYLLPQLLGRQCINNKSPKCLFRWKKRGYFSSMQGVRDIHVYRQEEKSEL